MPGSGGGRTLVMYVHWKVQNIVNPPPPMRILSTPNQNEYCDEEACSAYAMVMQQAAFLVLSLTCASNMGSESESRNYENLTFSMISWMVDLGTSANSGDFTMTAMRSVQWLMLRLFWGPECI